MTEQFTIEATTPTIGAAIHGLDLRESLGDDVVAGLREAWLEHQVLFFRDQHLNIEQQKIFARAFGELWTHPYLPAPADHPEVLTVRTKPGATKAPGQGWHTDMSAGETPPSASILRMEKVPPTGGDTLFANMYAAYDTLSPDWKRFIDPLDAWHSSAARHGGEFGLNANFERTLHPVVRTHPETGRKALFVNQGFTASIEAMSDSESQAVLQFLFRHCENPAFHVRFSWEPGSVAMWDNRCVMHHAVFDYDPEHRLGYRLTVTGDRPSR